VHESYDQWSESLRAMNLALRDGSLKPPGITAALVEMGYEIDHCVVFEVFLAEDSTWAVRLMNRTGYADEARINLLDRSKRSHLHLKEAYVLGKKNQIMIRAARDLHAELSDSSPYKRRKTKAAPPNKSLERTREG
jgi:hypothetical protein